MADKKQQVAVNERRIDSQLVITLYEGERVPEAVCTKAGRMTGQMIMGLEGANMARIDVELRRRQLELRRSVGSIPPENTRSLEERIMIPMEKNRA